MIFNLRSGSCNNNKHCTLTKVSGWTCIAGFDLDVQTQSQRGMYLHGGVWVLFIFFICLILFYNILRHVGFLAFSNSQ